MNFNLRKRTDTVRNAVRLVLSKKFYFFLAVLISIVAFFLFFVANTFPDIKSSFQATHRADIILKVLFNDIGTILAVSGPINFSAVVLVALLTGLVFSMIAYKFRFTKTAGKEGIAGAAGVFTGALAASCPACSITLLSLLGVSGGLAIFPFKGLEFSISALLLLAISLYFISKALVDCKECRIKF